MIMAVTYSLEKTILYCDSTGRGNTKLVLAFTMMDIAHENRLTIDTDRLSFLFYEPVVPLVGTTGKRLV